MKRFEMQTRNNINLQTSGCIAVRRCFHFTCHKKLGGGRGDLFRCRNEPVQMQLCQCKLMWKEIEKYTWKLTFLQLNGL